MSSFNYEGLHPKTQVEIKRENVSSYPNNMVLFVPVDRYETK